MMKKKTTGNKLKKEVKEIEPSKKKIQKKKITIKRNSLFF
jgi:hypothetical protein